MSGKKPSLGRGLAELSPFMAKRAGAQPVEPPVLAGDRLANLPLDLLQRGKYQPRVDMRPETLSELADSLTLSFDGVTVTPTLAMDPQGGSDAGGGAPARATLLVEGWIPGGARGFTPEVDDQDAVLIGPGGRRGGEERTRLEFRREPREQGAQGRSRKMPDGPGRHGIHA